MPAGWDGVRRGREGYGALEKRLARSDRRGRRGIDGRATAGKKEEEEEEERKKKRRKEAEKKRARKRAREEGLAAREPPLLLGRARIERRPSTIRSQGRSLLLRRKAATLVGCIIPLCARDTTTLPSLGSSTAAALLPRGVNKDERIARAYSPEASSLNPID